MIAAQIVRIKNTAVSYKYFKRDTEVLYKFFSITPFCAPVIQNWGDIIKASVIKT
jgi:hypothetical protein